MYISKISDYWFTQTSTSHLPYRFPFTLRIYCFSCKESIILFILLRDFPVSVTNSACFTEGFFIINSKTANSSKVHPKVSIWHFGNLGMALWKFRNGTLETFSIHKINMHISVFQFVIRTQKQVAKEHFQEFGRRMHTILQVVIVCSYQSISEIPGIFLKSTIVYMETKCFHVFNHKNRCCSGIAFTKRMYLPNVRSKLCQMPYRCIYGQSFI